MFDLFLGVINTLLRGEVLRNYMSRSSLATVFVCFLGIVSIASVLSEKGLRTFFKNQTPFQPENVALVIAFLSLVGVTLITIVVTTWFPEDDEDPKPGPIEKDLDNIIEKLDTIQAIIDAEGFAWTIFNLNIIELAKKGIIIDFSAEELREMEGDGPDFEKMGKKIDATTLGDVETDADRSITVSEWVNEKQELAREEIDDMTSTVQRKVEEMLSSAEEGN